MLECSQRLWVCLSGSALADVPDNTSNKDSILVTHDNGEMSLIQRASPSGLYVEVERVAAGLIQPQCRPTSMSAAPTGGGSGRPTARCAAWSSPRRPAAGHGRQPDRSITVDTYITPGRPNVGSNFAGVTPNGKTLWNSARKSTRSRRSMPIQQPDFRTDSHPHQRAVFLQGRHADRGDRSPCVPAT